MYLIKVGGPSDDGDWVGTHKLPNKNVSTERINCFPTDILLSEIKSKFITLAMLGAMVPSAKPD